MLICVMKNIKNIFFGFIALALVIVFYKLVSAISILIIVVIIGTIIRQEIQNLINENKLKKFRKNNEGGYFLLYSSNKKIKMEIEYLLKPLLTFKYINIYNNRNQIQSELQNYEIQHLKSESERLKFPIIYKIKNDNIYCASFFEEIQQYQKELISKTEFEKRINIKLKKIPL